MNHRVLHYVPFHRAEDWSKCGWIVVRPNIQCHVDAYVVVMEWLCGCAMPRPNKNESVDILCRSPGASSQESESMAIEASSQDADAMRKPKPSPDDIALALADALPRNAARRDELIAVGMVATALISGAADETRSELIEEFCSILRKSVAGELN